MKLLKFIFISILAMVMVSCSSYDEPEQPIQNLDEKSIFSAQPMAQRIVKSRTSQMIKLVQRPMGDGTSLYYFTYKGVEVTFYAPSNAKNGIDIQNYEIHLVGDSFFATDQEVDPSWHSVSGGGHTGVNVIVGIKTTFRIDGVPVYQSRKVYDCLFWIDFDRGKVTVMEEDL